MLTIARGETAGKTFHIQQGSNLVGRWDPDYGSFPEVDLESHDPEAKVSRRHAIIYLEGDQLTIEDVGSMNGTFVNRGKRLAPSTRQPLQHGDEIIIGKTFLTVNFEK